MKQIAKAWEWKSSTSDRIYQTLLYDDNSTSCNCPGWTRKVQPDGSRACRHTRSVEFGTADNQSMASKDYRGTIKADKNKQSMTFSQSRVLDL